MRQRDWRYGRHQAALERFLEKQEQTMGAKFYKQSTGSRSPKLVWDDHVKEALEKQAASRPAKGKPRIMPVTPTLPRVPKPYKRKKP